MNEVLQTEHLTHVYSAGTPFEKAALRDVSLTVYEGECLGIIGHTGSGKSTLIQHLNGLLRPTGGRILRMGKDVWAKAADVRALRFSVGLLFQYPEHQLFEETVAADVAFGPENMGLSAEETDRRVNDALAAVGLDASYRDKSPFALSGGEKRRVAMAGVLAMEPQVLILDEPTAGLDPAGREAMLSLIRDYRRKSGNTVVTVSHSMEEVVRFADRIAVMKDGGILTVGTPEEVFSHPEELLAAGISLPHAAGIAERLRAKGIPVPPGIFTVPALADALCRMEGGAPVC